MIVSDEDRALAGSAGGAPRRGVALVPLAVVAVLACTALSFAARPAAGDGGVTGADVVKAVDRGIQYLRDHPDEILKGYSQFRPGPQALRGLALLAAGLDPKADPLVASDLQAVLETGPRRTYIAGLEAMFMAAVDPEAHKGLIHQCSRWLQRCQGADGTWSYDPDSPKAGDHSNTQFALLGLYAAQESHLNVPSAAWDRTLEHFNNTQNPDGGWSYAATGKSLPTMTAAGAACLLIGQNRLAGARPCGDQPSSPRIRNALTLIGKQLAEFLKGGTEEKWPFYYLYAVERVGMLSGQKYVGALDWYREGASWLVQRQNADGSWGSGPNPSIDACFAILFLAKGHTPLLVNKLEWDGDWNNDASDLKNLLEFSAHKLRRRFSWQTVSVREPAEELGFAPVLFLNGHTAPKLGPGGVEKLRAFLDQGGLLFAESCCDRPEFDRGFRELVEQVVPGAKLAPLARDHAVYRTQFAITDPALQFLEGATYACRTAIVYSPRDLSCAWDNGCPYENGVSPENARQLGMNVLLYGMGSAPLRDKLDPKEVAEGLGVAGPGDAFVFAQVKHGGDWNPDPAAWSRVRELIGKEQGVRSLEAKRALALGDPGLPKYPFLYMTGHFAFSWSEAERASLRAYLAGSGTLFVESCCGKDAFNRSLREELRAVLPQSPLLPVPADDMIRHTPYPVGVGRFTPPCEGLERDLLGVRAGGRWVVVYSPAGVLCPVDGHECPACRSYVAEDGLHLAANVILHSLMH
ncbi:MAG: DUF4159 domain-containing protein [Planctomycetes bacterium]|nr:DUF4159 domain-containing protein [Planctomycetota bacterium]